VLSGRRWSDVVVPESTRSLGYIDDGRMPLLLNCMDTLVVINRDSAFGRYSHPVKLYEAMSCQVPVVVTATAATKWILRDHPELLVPPADPGALAASLAAALERGRIVYRDLPDWQSACRVFERALLEQVQP